MDKASLIGKIKITGKLVVKSPLLIGDGAGETAENFRDIHVLKNRAGKAFIPATSFCGVLRDWLENVTPKWTTKIFGDGDKMQSSIQLRDIELNGGRIITRDGVKIDGTTGTAQDGGKYDYEAIERGASGDLQLLINLRGCHDVKKISEVVELMLKKLQEGIRLGALTTKGFGIVVVENLVADLYDFRDKNDVIAWLLNKNSAKKILPANEKFTASKKDFIVDAEFKFNSSFIIRDYQITKTERDKNIYAVTLKSLKDFVIPGTSLKGILRHRAEYIFDKLNLDKKPLEELMGTSENKSRFIVAESYISMNNFLEYEHTRNKIDRFTGGTIQGTLFTTKPAYQKKLAEPTFKLHFEIRDAKDFEAGLAMFLLRDLWLGRVALGGEKSIGRGTVAGLSAEINFKGKVYKLDANGKIISGDKIEPENYAAALKNFRKVSAHAGT